MLARLRKQAGYTIAEVMVATGILVTVGLAGTTLIYVAADRQQSSDRMSARDLMVAELNRLVRDPRALRASLEKTDAATGQNRSACLRTVSGGTRVPCVAMAAPVGLFAVRFENDPDPITNANGTKCYHDKGAAHPTLATCDATHPIEVSVTFQIICVGQPSGTASSRTTCSSNQASIVTQFTVSPHSSLPPNRTFRRVRGTGVMEMKALFSLNDISAGILSQHDQVTKKDLTTLTRQFRKTCVNTGEVMIGVDAQGNPICKKIDGSCPPGQIFTGLRTVGVGAAATIQPVCTGISCGANEVFSGIDPSTGDSKCIPLSADTCSPYSSGKPTGQFMVGYEPPDAKPICRKKTCLKGEIFGGYGPDGNAICLTTNFIPICTPNGTGGGQACSATTAVPTPPPLNYFVNPTNNPGLPVPYAGVPYVSVWDSAHGLPRQGWRNDYRDWGTSPNNISVVLTDNNATDSNVRGGLFRDLIDSRGIQVECQRDTDVGNMTVQHRWTVNHTALNTACATPVAEDHCSGYYYTGTSSDRLNYVCHYRRDVTLAWWGDPNNCSCGAGPFPGWCPGGPWPGACGDPDGLGPLIDPNNCGPNPNNCGTDPRNCGCGHAIDGGPIGNRCTGGPRLATSGPHNYATDMGPETCTVVPNYTSNPRFNGDSVTAVCPTAHTTHNGNFTGHGVTKWHYYYNWNVRASCNFRYERGW